MGELLEEAVSRRRSPMALVSSFQKIEDEPLPPLTMLTATQAERLREVAKLTNQIREKHGKRKLAWANGLQRAADFHADDMAKRNYFSHNSKDGTPWWKVIKRFYKNPAGQNIARGFSSPEAVVKAWMNSPTHRKNILNGKFRTIGVGFNTDGDYWVQDFGY